MKRTDYILRLAFGAIVALGAAACSEDPTAADAGKPIAIETTRSVIEQTAGNSFTFVASALDATGTRIAAPITITSVSPDVATLDSAVYHPELAETRAYITAQKVGANAFFVLTAGGVSDTVTVNVLTGPFPGTVATAAASGGTALTFTSATPIFDSDTDVQLGTAVPGYLVSITPTKVTYLLPFGTAAGPITYSITKAGPNDFNLSGTYNLTTAVPSADTFEPNNSPTTAKALTPGTDVFGSLTGTDADDFYTLTVTTAAKFTVQADWNDGADIDIYVTNANGDINGCTAGAAGNDYLGCKAATGAQPEVGTTPILQPGTYRVYVNLYAGDSPATTYRLRVTQVP